MPGHFLHMGATVTCMHGGPAQPSAANARVLVSGQPITTLAAPYLIAACPFVPPGGNGPCVSAQWVLGAVRVLAGGVPVLLQDGQAVCAPTGTALQVVVTQIRVKGT
jgi:hypothetical protein